MDFPPSQTQPLPNAPPSPVILPNDLIAEVLSYLPVKTLMQLKSVNKSWKSIISDPNFAKLHLHRSAAQSSDFTIVSNDKIPSYSRACFTVFRLLENPPIINRLPYDPYYKLEDYDCRFIVGSCNGLLCLFGSTLTTGYTKTWLRFWNPATRTISEKLGIYLEVVDFPFNNITFVYDNSSDTYKVVAFDRDISCRETTEVRVFSLGDKIWRNIKNSPRVHSYPMHVVNLRNSVNWLSIPKFFNSKGVIVDQYVIISLDLCTETYTQLKLPQGFDEIPSVLLSLSLLKDCLCFSYEFRKIHFVVWQMKEFGVEESWIQFLKISYQDLQIDRFFNVFIHMPIHIIVKGDTLLLTNNFEAESIIDNWKDNRVKRNQQSWWSYGMEYVESLVSYC